MPKNGLYSRIAHREEKRKNVLTQWHLIVKVMVDGDDDKDDDDTDDDENDDNDNDDDDDDGDDH